ncbi:jg16241 [Pararge aegeria aegeria]|uniref:Jg16241 protein n=1 Tax=Pararge aegeria aegeria TaxID=348720 RepID=A0A8S4RUU4_9NEOP|nr:jg16241 [Pararge aegeria aegeria]
MAQENINGEPKLEKELLAPYTHLLQVSGKQMRVKIILALNHWLQVPEDKLRFIVDTVNMLHNGTLLVDDVQDSANIRRGIPTAHRIYGVPITLNATMHIILLSLKEIMKLGPKASEIYVQDFLEALRGQGTDLYWRENFVCPTEEEYKTMVEQKTGRMLTLSSRVLQLFSEFKTDLTDFVLHLGYYFQMRDDYCNLKQQEALEEWPGPEDTQAIKDATFCDDITEGKFSFPIIHAMKTPEGSQILNILRQRTQDVQLKKYCVSLLEKVGSLQYTRDVLAKLDRAARAEVARLGGNPQMEAVLDELMSWKD